VKLHSGQVKRLRHSVPFALFLGLLMLAGYLAARLTWELAGVTAPSAAGLSEKRPYPRRQATKSSLGDLIASAHLYGSAKGLATSSALMNAPETNLNLTLVGVAAGAKIDSRAIIASGSSGIEKTYSIGATLPDGTQIRTILPDRVILSHNGRFEALRLPVTGTSILATHMNFGNPPPQKSAGLPFAHRQRFQRGIGPPPPPRPSILRHQFRKNPGEASRYIRFRRYVNQGKVRGYRIYPGADPILFQRAGLRPGDIVTAIDGIKLDSPVGAAQALSRLRKPGEAIHLKILRAGRETTLTINPGG